MNRFIVPVLLGVVDVSVARVGRVCSYDSLSTKLYKGPPVGGRRAPENCAEELTGNDVSFGEGD